MSERDLYHWGIKGMKWGIRRFQNKDGTLTPLGKKRDRAKNDDDSEKSTGKKSSGPRSVKDMSDQELRDRINRLNLERQALDLDRQVKGLSPSETSNGSSFIKKFANDAIKPAVINAGREQLTKMLNKALSKQLGLDTEDSLGVLKKTVDELNLKKMKRDLEESLNRDDSLKREVDQLNLRKQRADLEYQLSDEGRRDAELKLWAERYKNQSLSKKYRDALKNKK